MDRRTFDKIRKIVYEKSGISLSENKEALVQARVGKRMRALDIKDHQTYLRYVFQDKSGDELVHMIDSISTNVTNFFREPDHFHFLSEVMSKWLSAGQKRFRFWSAACSTGEEPYTIAMTLLKTAGENNLDLKILATDISTKVLDICSVGTYKKEKTESISKDLKRQYFDEKKNGSGTTFTVKKSLRNIVVFKRLNLSTPPFPMKGPLDAVFCRNVMIYFDNNVRKKLLDEMSRLLKPGGYLMVGHAESLAGMMSNLNNVRPSIYVKK